MDSTDTRQGQAPHDQRPSWQQRLRRFGYAAGPRSDVRDRLVPPYAEPSPRLWAALGFSPALVDRINRWSGWGGPLLVTLLAGAMRFYHLGSPKAVIFDETYYAKDAWALVHRGFEVNWDKNANDLILQHNGHVPIPTDAAYVVHPPVGKYVIGLGELIFGFNPFGWRFMTALLGTLAILLLCRIGRRLFRSTFLGCVAGVMMSLDGLAFVMARTSLLDGVLMFFVVAAFGCLLLDRDRARARLAAALPVDSDGRVRPDAHIADTLSLGWRPWRWMAGLTLGLAMATKWNGMFYAAAFVVMAVLWDVGSRKVAGASKPYTAVLKHDVGLAFISTAPVAISVYVLSWLGWILSPANGTGGYFRNWAATDGKGGFWSQFMPDWVRSLWHYEHEVYEFNVGLHSPHTYMSNPWSWLVDGRPVSYFYESPSPGSAGCPVSAGEKCAREVLAIGTPSSGGPPASPSSTSSGAGPSAATGARARSPAAWRPATSLVHVPGPHDLLLLLHRLPPVPVPGGSDADRRGHRPTWLQRHPPGDGRGGRGRTRPPGHLELHLLLAAVHGDGDSHRPVAVEDVAGHLGVAGWAEVRDRGRCQSLVVAFSHAQRCHHTGLGTQSHRRVRPVGQDRVPREVRLRRVRFVCPRA